MTRGVAILALLASLSWATAAGAGDDGDTLLWAKAFFALFTTSEQAYDPATVDFYADDAEIVIVSTGANGDRARVVMTGAQYKQLARDFLPNSEAAEGAAVYADPSYSLEDGLVRIRATRTLVKLNFAAPYSILIGRSPSGEWQIQHELSIAPR